ncbi:E3 ubiquitin-protein ligase RNF12-A-like [Mesocricetus auratus]|uniref:E3 ubiquitin-protein ligase RNF12-A-like n=1 Tax=Mesocricetus auratus TaxID=10036 RepID=A0ABM2X8B4_MESAU|nr:E3 ubiquitin-protein ligase RNF12-A-like [Mesocricetus auratus]XP_040599756.1 E3 ubiquitin-protein ligase RNF12-A-like [Mesocricetus auratus]
MFPYDIDSYQPTPFIQHEVMAEEEQRELCSWEETSLNKSQGYNFMERESVNDNYENPALTHDHLFFARLLGEQNMKKNQRQVENSGSKSMFRRSNISEGNATDTLMEVTSTRIQTRRRQRSLDNWRERRWMERELMEYNQRQREYPQSESILAQAGESKEDEPEIVRVYNRPQKRTRRNPRLPQVNDWNRCGAKTSDVFLSGESERGQYTFFQPSEKRTQREIVECGFWKTEYKSNTNNISGRMRSTFNNKNLNPQNDHALLPGLGCHDTSRNSQKQRDHQQPKSTLTPGEGITEILMDSILNRDRECTKSESPDAVIVGDMTKSRLPQPTQLAALLGAHYSESDESSSDLEFDEPCLLCQLQSRFPLCSEFEIIRTPKSSLSSSTREQIENTAHGGQSTSVTSTEKEHTNISSHSGQTDMQNSKIFSVAQTSNTGLDSTVTTAPYGTSGQIMTEIFEGERGNCIDNNLEACDSFSSENSRRVHSGDSNSSTTCPLVSLSRPSQQFLPTRMIEESSIFSNTNLPAAFQSNECSNEPVLSSNSLFGTRQETQFANEEGSEDSDSWETLPDFINYDDIPNNHTEGLTKEQIGTFPVRAFSENDKLCACNICLTEYTESSKILMLPCFHEYHDECIHPWLSENSTCPTCRRQIINTVDT